MYLHLYLLYLWPGETFATCAIEQSPGTEDRRDTIDSELQFVSLLPSDVLEFLDTHGYSPNQADKQCNLSNGLMGG